jgi:hypothetical protein
MPRYIALIEVMLDEPTIAGAMETARELATKICNDSLTTDCARATTLQRTGESYREELIDIDPSFSIVEEVPPTPLPNGPYGTAKEYQAFEDLFSVKVVEPACHPEYGYCTVEDCKNPVHGC